jgi:hypothetical protein
VCRTDARKLLSDPTHDEVGLPVASGQLWKIFHKLSGCYRKADYSRCAESEALPLPSQAVARSAVEAPASRRWRFSPG